MTEDEARKKWCPFARVPDGGGADGRQLTATNRHAGTKTGRDGKPRILRSNAMCIASECASRPSVQRGAGLTTAVSPALARQTSPSAFWATTKPERRSTPGNSPVATVSAASQGGPTDMCTSCGWADQFSDDPSAPGVNTLPEPEPANENEKEDPMSDPVRLTKRQQSKAATRAKVLESARRLWAEPGTYEFFGIRDIAAGAGMSTGAVFANFDSKADLWREAMGYEPPVDGPEVRALLQRMAQLREAA